jgi:hypothetical protein
MSVLPAESQRTYSSAASSPALGSIYSPLPSTRHAILQDNDDLDSNFGGDDGQSVPGAQGRKRLREDDDFADTDGGEQPSKHPQEQAQDVKNAPPAKSGIVVHGEPSLLAGALIRIDKLSLRSQRYPDGLHRCF